MRAERWAVGVTFAVLGATAAAHAFAARDRSSKRASAGSADAPDATPRAGPACSRPVKAIQPARGTPPARSRNDRRGGPRRRREIPHRPAVSTAPRPAGNAHTGRRTPFPRHDPTASSSTGLRATRARLPSPATASPTARRASSRRRPGWPASCGRQDPKREGARAPFAATTGTVPLRGRARAGARPIRERSEAPR